MSSLYSIFDIKADFDFDNKGFHNLTLLQLHDEATSTYKHTDTLTFKTLVDVGVMGHQDTRRLRE